MYKLIIFVFIFAINSTASTVFAQDFFFKSQTSKTTQNSGAKNSTPVRKPPVSPSEFKKHVDSISQKQTAEVTALVKEKQKMSPPTIQSQPTKAYQQPPAAHNQAATPLNVPKQAPQPAPVVKTITPPPTPTPVETTPPQTYTGFTTPTPEGGAPTKSQDTQEKKSGWSIQY